MSTSLRDLLTLPRKTPREVVISRLAGLPEAERQSTIEALLADEDLPVRDGAIDIARDVIGERALDLLLEVYRNDPSERIRMSALRYLEDFSTNEIFAVLRGELGHPTGSREPIQIVANQLRNYDSEESVDMLLGLVNHWDAYVAQPAIESLSELNRPRLRKVWEAIAENWEGLTWGDTAVRALAKLPPHPDDDKAAEETFVWWVEGVRAQLSSDDTRSRSTAVQKLAAYVPDDPATLTTLLRFATDNAESVRMAAVSALGNYPTPEAASVLKQAAEGDSWEPIRYAAVRALGKHRTEFAFRTLLDRADRARDLTLGERNSLAIALGHFDRDAARSALRRMVDADENADTQVLAAECLLDIDSEDLTPNWEAWASHPNEEVAEFAQVALRRRKTT